MAQKNIDQMKQVLNNLENAVPGPQVIEWLEKITDPSFRLIASLVANFLEKVNTDPVTSKEILIIIRQLNHHVREKVQPQLMENQDFPRVLTSYIKQTDASEIPGDVFILLTQVFNIETFKTVLDEEIIGKLFDSLEFIQNEAVYKALIEILVLVGCQHSRDAILHHCSTHKNARFFGETLLNLLNRGEERYIQSCLTFTMELFENEATKESFFYTNDMRTLTDVLIREVQQTSNEDLRVMYFEVLKLVLTSNDWKTHRHRESDIREVMDEIANRPYNHSAANSPFAKQVLELLNE